MDQDITLNWSDIFLSGICTVRDLWLHTDLDINDKGITLSVATHETKLLKITPTVKSGISELIESKINFYAYYKDKNLYVDYQLLDDNCRVKIELMNLNGSIVSLIENKLKEKGNYKNSIDCSKLVAGFYICQLQTNEGQMCKKVIVN